ncbi:MAG: KH domain-containing protein [Bacteroidales bacterium]|jgi:predicted RNA-binding protein YlqC (UPF0109 family)|nr:KH domain-containing protein [Bacteroidales bacterium]
MNTVKNNTYAWVYKNLLNEPIYSADQIEAMNKFKSLFKIFFEGCNDYGDPIHENYVPIRNFEITDLKFSFDQRKMIITIVLGRPGILIGKGGKTIDSLKEYINGMFKEEFDEVKLNIQESKLWWPINTYKN